MVYTCTCFEGHWPVGVSAVVVAESRAEAAKLLEAELAKQGLAQDVPAEYLEELDESESKAVVLQNGEY